MLLGQRDDGAVEGVNFDFLFCEDVLQGGRFVRGGVGDKLFVKDFEEIGGSLPVSAVSCGGDDGEYFLDDAVHY